MFCRALIALLLLLSAPARAQDPWFGPDKNKHLLYSAVFTSGAYALAAPLNQRARVGTAVGVGLGVGVAKELLDLSGAGQASWRDLTWDAAGVTVGLALALGVHALVRRPMSPQLVIGRRRFRVRVGTRF